jgi:hypothetical protein
MHCIHTVRMASEAHFLAYPPGQDEGVFLHPLTQFASHSVGNQTNFFIRIRIHLDRMKEV